MKQARSDGTFDINYDDGESETRVDPDLVRAIGGGSTLLRSESPPARKPVRLGEGDKVEANFRGRGKWYPGRISRDRGDGTYDVAYDDGESEMRVGAELIRSKALEGSLRMSAEQKPRIEEGSKVEANYRGKGKWYPGRVKQIALRRHLRHQLRRRRVRDSRGSRPGAGDRRCCHWWAGQKSGEGCAWFASPRATRWRPTTAARASGTPAA